MTTWVRPDERVAWPVAAVAMAVAALMLVGRGTLVRRATDGPQPIATQTGTRARVAGE